MKSKTLHVRMTPEQYERIKNKTQAKGYSSISAFVLHSTLEKDLVFEQKFDEMYRCLKKQAA